VIDGPGIVILRLKVFAVPCIRLRRGNSVNPGPRKAAGHAAIFQKSPRRGGSSRGLVKIHGHGGLHPSIRPSVPSVTVMCQLALSTTLRAMTVRPIRPRPSRRINTPMSRSSTRSPLTTALIGPSADDRESPATAPPQSRDCRWQVGRPESPQTGSVRSFPVEAGA
jgi:hypothetical protein